MSSLRQTIVHAWSFGLINQHSWLVSSVGKALHRYRKGHGFKSRTGLIFFIFFFSGLLFTTAYVVFITAKIAFIFTVDNVNWPPWRVYTRVYNLLKLIRRTLYNISIHLLHTLPYTFPKILARRIRWKIKASWVLRSFPLFSGFKTI